MKHLLISVFTMLNLSLVIAQPTTVGLVGYWKMDGNFNDAGPYAIHGSNFGATATTNIAAQANKAMQFLNPSASATTVVQWGTIPVNSNFSFTGNQDFTIAFYVFANSPFVHTGGLYDNNLNYGGPGIWFWSAPGTPTVQFNYKNISVGTLPGTFPIGQWVHICAVRASGTLKLYINGILNNSGTEGTQAPAYGYPARLGTMFFSSYPHYNGFNGKMDELRIYNRALSDIEILGVLPVKLTSFTGVNKNGIVTLNWQTQYEQNSSHYNIQRSIDGVGFADVTKVTAAGNSNIPRIYDYIDVLPSNVKTQKTVFYRLQSVDVDGNFSYSQVVALRLDKTDIQIYVFPNPARDVLQVQTGNSLAGNSVLIISDAAGRQVYKKEVVLLQGSNTIPVNISFLSAGMYTARLINGNESFTKQFLKD